MKYILLLVLAGLSFGAAKAQAMPDATEIVANGEILASQVNDRDRWHFAVRYQRHLYQCYEAGYMMCKGRIEPDAAGVLADGDILASHMAIIGFGHLRMRFVVRHQSQNYDCDYVRRGADSAEVDCEPLN